MTLESSQSGSATWPRHVRQEHASGCGPAALAMILGTTYAEACALIEASPAHGKGGDWETGGTNHMALDHVLQQYGFWRQRTYRAWYGDENWPPKPWAEVHLCQIEQPSRNAHFVVMLANGDVLDPMIEAPVGLGLYPDVLNVCGLMRGPERTRAFGPMQLMSDRIYELRSQSISRNAFVRGLVPLYREDPVHVATILDEQVDRSGRLLGLVRTEARRG